MSSKKLSSAGDTVNLECKNLSDYLKSQPAQVITKLYEFPAICLAVYRDCIPDIAKQFVIRMLCVDQPVPQAVVSSWGSQVYAKWVNESRKFRSHLKFPLFDRDNLAACNSLTELKIWAIASLPGGLAAWDLNPFFKRNLKIAWLGG